LSKNNYQLVMHTQYITGAVLVLIVW